MIRVMLPAHLRTLAQAGSEVTVEVEGRATLSSVLDALEAQYPMLRGTLRDHVTKQRRPYVRFFACQEDLSHEPADTPLPEAVVSGKEPFLIVGAIAGGSEGAPAVEGSAQLGYPGTGDRWCCSMSAFVRLSRCGSRHTVFRRHRLLTRAAPH